MEEKLRNFEEKEGQKYVARKRICIIIASIIIVADILNLIRFVLEYLETYMYTNWDLATKVSLCILIYSFVMLIYAFIDGYLLNAMYENIEIKSKNMLFDYLGTHGCVKVKVKYGCGVSHDAYDFIKSSDNHCELYAKSVSEQVYIFACDETGKELACWIETVNNFFYHFVAIEEEDVLSS